MGFIEIIITDDFTWIFILLIILLITMIYTVHKLSSNKPQPLISLPPGPRKLPLIGNLHQLAAVNSLPHHRLAELARKYGSIMHLQVGEVSTIVVSSADVAMDVMKTNDASCCSRPELMIGKEVFYGCSDIAFAPYGEYWRQVRKIAILELFTPKRVKSFRSIREEEVGSFIDSIGSKSGSLVNLSEKIFDLQFDITCRATFSRKGKDQSKFRALAAAQVALASSFCIADIYPSSKLLYLISGMRRKLQEAVRGANTILDPIIEEHKLKINNIRNKQENDFVDVLLKFHQDNANDGDFFLTTSNIKAIIWILFIGGSETVSATVEWAMSELIRNPRVMKKAKDEVRLAFESKGEVNETKLEKLNYLKMVIKETLRLYPPSPLIPRESIESCKIGCYDIPSKTRIIINAWAIARDPKYWLDVENFIPERFENSTINYKGTNFEFVPFGAGKRVCPGMAAGIANIELPLAMLLYHFDWELPNQKVEELNMDESYGIAVRRKNDLLVIPISYI